MYIAILAVIGRAATQKDLRGLKGWADSNFGKYSKGQCNILPCGSNQAMQQYRVEISWLKGNFREKDMQVSWNTGGTCQQHPFVQLDITRFLHHNVGQMQVLDARKSCGISVLKFIQKTEHLL